MGERRDARKRPGAPSAGPHLERLLWRVGIEHVAGVDEVGMGPLAGPVVAAAVVLPREAVLDGVADSKLLRAAERERLDGEIRVQAIAIGIGVVESSEIDRVNIYQAAMQAKRDALAALGLRPGFVLVDGREIPGLAFPQSAYPKGDGFVLSIAAASIVAKVHRDALMRDLDEAHPGYGFGRHMGYATAAHLRALRELGPSPIHRRSFAPLANEAQLSLGVLSR
ncbi:MAG TPA: ribonuclease HII [Candidatus Eisenbacteria bacterium]|nr:ribonuclease HII [Candidatus Eisenbacteria bacterium]